MITVRPTEVNGIISIDKPFKATSMDVVREVKRRTRTRRVGHGGTLDPVAVGVLPICFGQATRIMEYLINGTKRYSARVRLGVSTDTYDSLGTVIAEQDSSKITREQVEDALPSFTGAILQQPPMFSALKRDGKRLYQLARAGVEVDRPARLVHIFELVVIEWAPPVFTIETECGRGVYMRSLVHDLGEALGCGAHLDSLSRLRAGPFSLEHALSLAQFTNAVEEADWLPLVRPIDTVLLDLEAVLVDTQAERALRNGQAIALDPRSQYSAHLEGRRVYNKAGHFVGIVRFHKGQGVWQPEKVFKLQDPSPHCPGLVKH